MLCRLLAAGCSRTGPRNAFITSPFSGGIVNGYLTMDTLAGLAFGLVVVNAIRARGLHDRHHITRYTTRPELLPVPAWPSLI